MFTMPLHDLCGRPRDIIMKTCSEFWYNYTEEEKHYGLI